MSQNFELTVLETLNSDFSFVNTAVREIPNTKFWEIYIDESWLELNSKTLKNEESQIYTLLYS